MTRPAPPPLPDLDALASGSEWLAGRSGLDAELGRLRAHAAGTLPQLRKQAGSLASPRLRPRSLLALLRTLARFLWFGLLSLRQVFGRRGGLSRSVRRAQRLVAAGGPAYVKVGQSIATAQGLLPDEWVAAFAWCRDEVPPMPPGLARRAVEAGLGRPIESVFASFVPTPRAAASIAQVHDAVLPDGTEVVVKVQRPGLRARFAADLAVMSLLAAGATRASASARIVNPSAILPLAAELVLAELDFRLEALNMIHLALASESAGTTVLRVPRPIPGLVTADVLVMERVPGVPYTAAGERYREAVDGPKLLRAAAEAVVEHALIYGVFHGDLHSGNVLITETGTISLVDYGVCGRIDARERALLVRLLVGALRQDAKAQVLAAAELGAIPADVDLDAAIAELDGYQSLVTEFTDARFDSLDLTVVTRQLRAVIASLATFGFRVPKELVLFSRNLLYLNGFAATLAPAANMLAELEALLAHMVAKYPQELTAILAGALGVTASAAATEGPAADRDPKGRGTPQDGAMPERQGLQEGSS